MASVQQRLRDPLEFGDTAALDQHRVARSEDNLFTAWLTAANAARLMLADGRATEAVPWARAAVRALSQPSSWTLGPLALL